MGFIWPL